MYQERPSRLPGAFVWRRTAEREPRAGRVLPDGCMDLLWWRGDLVVAGPDTVAYESRLEPGETIVGLRFAPGVAPAALGVPADELRDSRVRLAALWPARAVREAVDRVAAARGRVPSGAVLGDAATARAVRAGVAAAPGRALEEIAAGRLAEVGGPDRAVTAVVPLLRAGASVAAVAGEVGLSERQLHRRSLSAFGYGPKTLARILRLERALALARAGAPLAAVAAESGYADQAHLSRDARALGGAPVGTLIRP
ncbi:helix-turn-helix domain-containing protein [Phytohabitans sp. ZYX-F-186]|uniref:Helix-turn-helix domain-containing protein n=1 Tax=Phytohabitans maris TaxID=3071409 RepID=A0ABU0ZSA5_9ACTN|nr:helix-turn-helix domain-containing protein [Phytohabitans sp. ZYX-F-186]MDQ7908827.1 helix-turn-helix domain-containing protein [Phytohabitans sp. ZYX-F-186]